MDFFGTYCTHVQTCDNVRVQSATEWTSSVHTAHMSKPVITFVFKALRMDCFGSYLTHVQTCDTVRAQTATEWTASVHTAHMSKPVIPFVLKVLWNGLLRFILHTCPNLWYRSCSKCYGMDCFGSFCTHVQTCDNVRVQSATEWTASALKVTIHFHSCRSLELSFDVVKKK